MQTLTIANIDVQLLRYRLPKPVGGSGVAIVDVIVTDLTLSDQTSGLGLTFVPAGGADIGLRAARHLAERTLLDQPLHHPEATWTRMAGALNRTRRGPNYLGMSSLDVAIWDAYAKHLGVPLGIAMGGAPRSVKVYGSGGFIAAQSPDEVAAIARACRPRPERRQAARQWPAQRRAGDARNCRGTSGTCGVHGRCQRKVHRDDGAPAACDGARAPRPFRRGAARRRRYYRASRTRTRVSRPGRHWRASARSGRDPAVSGHGLALADGARDAFQLRID